MLRIEGEGQALHSEGEASTRSDSDGNSKPVGGEPLRKWLSLSYPNARSIGFPEVARNGDKIQRARAVSKWRRAHLVSLIAARRELPADLSWSNKANRLAIMNDPMTQERWTAVDRYIRDLLVPPDPALDAALRASAAAGLPPINVSPNQGKLLMLLAQLQGARNVLEIGTLGGYSTIWLGRGLSQGGRLITLEADPKHAELARGNIARAGLAEVVEVILGRAIDTLPQLAATGRGPFDLIFIDADKPSLPDYFAWSLKLSRPGSVIVIDNVIRHGTVIDAASTAPDVQGARRMNEMMAAEKRVTATAIQTVGSKGYDGFAIARVNTER